MSSRRARVCKVTMSMMPRSFEDQRGCLVRRDDRAGDHGLARSWRRNEHPEIVPGQFGDGRTLGRCQDGRKGERLRGML
jgi:hypothetical protein